MEATDPAPMCLALVQLTGRDALAYRVPAAIDHALDLYEAELERLVPTVGGTRLVSALKGELIAFDTPLDAVAFSLHLQECMLHLDWPEPLQRHPEAAEEHGSDGTLLFRGLRAGIAIHIGPAATAFGRAFGPAVYQVGRIAAVGSGGQTLMSDAAWTRLRGRLPTASVLRDLGRHPLAGVHGLTHLFQLLPAALDARVLPPLATPAHAHTNAPPQPAPIIGREGDLASVTELFALGVRLVTIVGHEGVGRARFLHQLALHPPAAFVPHGGSWLVRPRGASDLELVRATAAAIRAPTAHARTLDDATVQIGHALRALGPTLLAFDGPIGSIEPIARWLHLAPELRVALHRAEPIGTPNEIPYLLRDLLPPVPADAGRHDDVVRIYARAATLVDPSFHLDDPLDASIIAHALGGRPQALLLAGGIADRVPPARLAAELLGTQLAFDDLVARVLTALSDDERRVLNLCAMIPGAFEQELLWWLADVGADGESNTIDHLQQLVRRGLIAPAPSAERPLARRLRVDDAVRDYIHETLSVDAKRELQSRIAEGLLVGAEMWVPYVLGKSRPECLARLDMDVDGLLAVVRWAMDDDDPTTVLVDQAARAVLVLQPVLRSRGPLPLEQHLQDAVLALCDRCLDNDPSHQLRLLLARANGAQRAGHRVVFEADLARARSIGERWHDLDGLARLSLVEGRVAFAMGHTDAALAELERAHERFLELDDPIRAAVADIESGAVAVAAGRFEPAEVSLLRASRKLFEQEAPHARARALAVLAQLYRRTHRPASARSTSREALRIYETTGSPVAECQLRQELANLDYQLARYGEATDGLLVAVTRAREIGDRAVEGRSLYLLALVALARADHGSARRTLLESLALAREQEDGPREGEVMGLLGLVHHLDERPTAARDFYRQALAKLQHHQQGRRGAMFTAWLGQLEAEQLNIDEAEAAFRDAERALLKSQDPEVSEALSILKNTLLLARNVNDGDPELGRQALLTALRGTDPRALSGQGRLAFRRARRLASRGLTPSPAAPDEG